MVEQRTLDWYRSRLGKITGSAVGKLMVSGRKKDELFGQTALSYINKVASERMLHQQVYENDGWLEELLEQTNVTSKAMQWGIDNEDKARKLYSLVNDVEVVECPSVVHPTIPNFAASPDGYITVKNGTIEIKCIGLNNWLSYFEMKEPLDLKALNPEYYWQCYAEMSCAETDFTDFTIYNPFMATPLKTLKIERDDDVIAQLEERVILANQLIEHKLNNL